MGQKIVASEKQEQAIHDAGEISSFMGNATVKSVFQQMQDAAVDAWRLARTPEDREYFWMQDRAVETVWTLLKSVVDNGKVAQDEIERAIKRRPDLDPNKQED